MGRRFHLAMLLTMLAMPFAAGPAAAGDRVPVAQPVTSCPQHGPGFVQVPGTTTCIRIGGRVRSEYDVSARRVSRDSISGMRTSGTVSVDSRTDTAYGPLRSYVRVRAGQATGSASRY